MDMRCGYADADGGQVHYRSAGTAGPAVVCFHQTPLSSRLFERALPLLGECMRAFAFDTPGYGGSTPLDREPDLPAFAQRLLAAIDSLGVERTAVCGFATGAAVAVEVARRLGDRATHLILSGTPVLSPERQADFGRRLGKPDMKADGSHLMQVWNARVDNFGPENDLEEIQMAVSETLRVYERMHFGLLAVEKYDLEQALRTLNVPTLFLTAEHDKLAPENRRAARLVAGAKEVFLDGAQPQVCWTDPPRFVAAVRDFVGLG